jgi:hypothetical protein
MSKFINVRILGIMYIFIHSILHKGILLLDKEA